MFVITQVHMMAGGTGYEHIERVRYRTVTSPGAPDAEAYVYQVVGWIKSGIEVWSEGKPVVPVEVAVTGHREYIKTKADYTTTNNLLSLPKY